MGTVTYVDFRKGRTPVLSDDVVKDATTFHAKKKMREYCSAGWACYVLALLVYAAFLFLGDPKSGFPIIAVVSLIGFGTFMGLGALAVSYRLKNGSYGTAPREVRDITRDLRTK